MTAAPPARDGRVLLRPLAAGDQDEFLRLVQLSADLHHPWMSLATTPREFGAFLRRFDQVSAVSLAVCAQETGVLAGIININNIIRGRYQNGSIAYAAFAPTAGQGYMAEGMALMLRYAFMELRLHRLDAQIQPGNHASIRLVQRLGFCREGFSPELLYIDGAWRDHERWAITNQMAGLVPDQPHPTLPRP